MRRGGGKRLFLLSICLLGFLLFTALGIWQVERRTWKLDLIERVNTRVNAPPAPVPPRRAWPQLDARDIEYRRVRAAGRFLHDRETRVGALTELGPGAWVVTPLRTVDGVILVNRGFAPPAAGEIARPAGEVRVSGLMRLSVS